jgi:TRAP-type C4-dicarboxylate transport system substrate-binding protein
MDLPFIAPDTVWECSLLQAALWELPSILQELDKWNAVPLLPAGVAKFTIMGNKAISKVEDLKGVRVRVSGDMGRVLGMYGAVPTMIPISEVYEALSRGTIDVAASPYPVAHASFKLHEVSKYNMPQLNLGTMCGPFVANKGAWEALPKEFKDLHKMWYRKAHYEFQRDIDEGELKWIPEFKKKMEFVEFPPEELRKLEDKAKDIWEEWVKRLESDGFPARQILNYFILKKTEISRQYKGY